jgi:glutathione synthase/RimK-type ligase-like ATP-grasp enzyme
MKKVGICFSKDLQGNSPLSHIVTKISVYLRLLDFINAEGWDAYILTRKTYKGNGKFAGGWKYLNGKFLLITTEIQMDLVYDKSGGLNFPLEGDSLKVINNREFKILCWDKWATYSEIKEYMCQTVLIENESGLIKIQDEIKTDWVVLKPSNGLKGLGVYIGQKEDALNFKFPEKYPRYIAQEFIDTSNGIPGITEGLHDLRVAVVNGNVVWCHVRVPAKGTYTANAARGGNLTEVDYAIAPDSIKEIVKKISEKFLKKYDNPIFSLDFGIDKDGTPKIFEINDQIGFPKWGMKNRDAFLKGLVNNFKTRLSKD